MGENKKVGQEQVHKLLFGEKLSWRAIIFDLINSEQLDPWDVDISLLSSKYLERVKDMEGHDFFVSSKVLLAAALLLRIKSEILLNHDIPNLNDVLFGRKDDKKKYIQERIELDDDIPDLIPRTPIPRFRRVTLQELMNALNSAIKTETRRIRRVTVEKQHEIEAAINLPKKRINIRDEIRNVYSQLKKIFNDREQKISFSEFAGTEKEDRIAKFIPLLHLDTQHRVWLEQDGHFEEIWIWLKELYEKQNAEELKRMEREVDEEIEELGEKEKSEEKEIRDSFKNPIGDQTF